MTVPGPVHPCPVCDSPDQTCTHDGVVWSGDATDITDCPDPGPGPLRPYVVDGVGVLLSDADARRAGLLDEEDA